MDNNDIDPEMEKGGKQGSIELGGKEFEMTIVEANEDDLSDEFWDGVEGAKPPMLMVLKQVNKYIVIFHIHDIYCCQKNKAPTCIMIFLFCHV